MALPWGHGALGTGEPCGREIYSASRTPARRRRSHTGENVSTGIPVWTWRDAIRKAPVPALTKHVCNMIANYVSDVGTGCFPSVKSLMADTGLSNRTLATHVQNAIDAGLLEITRKAGPDGRFQRTTYLPRFPAACELPRRAADMQPVHNEAGNDDEPELQVKDLHLDRSREGASPGPREDEAGSPREPDAHRTIHRELSTSPSVPSVSTSGAQGGGGKDWISGWAVGWTPEAREVVEELRFSPIDAVADVADVFIAAVRGSLSPPRHADAAAFVRQLGSQLRAFDKPTLERLAARQLETRGTYLEAVANIAQGAKAPSTGAGAVKAEVVGVEISAGSAEWGAWQRHFRETRRAGVAAAMVNCKTWLVPSRWPPAKGSQTAEGAAA